MPEREYFTIKGKAYWAFINKRSDMSGKYQLELSHLGPKAREFLEEKGISVKKDSKEKDGELNENYKGYFVTCKSDYKPKTKSAKLQLWPDDLLLGNGTVVNVKTHVYPWVFRNEKTGKVVKTGDSLGLDAVQVLDLVEYERKEFDDGFEEVEGFELPEDAAEDDDFDNEIEDTDFDDEDFDADADEVVED